MASLIKRINIGTVSWIAQTPNPLKNAGFGRLVLEPNWIFDTYAGLVATSNPSPPASIMNFRNYQTQKQFRALTFCSFEVEIDRESNKIMKFQVIDAIHDGGWTPPFDTSKVFATKFAALIDENIKDRKFYQGEASPDSLVYTERLHPNSGLERVSKKETVLANGIIKFRAGKHTDDIGIKIGCPFHVPWVWCEFLLTYLDGQCKFYGRGSSFPSHAWYFNGRQVHQTPQVSDSTFPILKSGIIKTIDIPRLRIYPVLKVGAPSTGPQVGLNKNNGPVDSHSRTVAGGAKFSRSVTV